jgi:hypothetical protein
MKRYAIFFPQFHATKVNDDAWGYGFTDWVLVAVANAFGYWSRRAPKCGFYNLSNDKDIKAQFETAHNVGLDGFGIYHYRFNDGPELDLVEKYLMREKVPNNFGFFFIWANEDWTTRWIKGDVQILKKIDDIPNQGVIEDHVNYLLPFMKSNSYTKINGRPLFVIYRPDGFKSLNVTIALYRKMFEKAGLNPFIGFFVKNVADVQYSSHFDFCYLFEPRLFFNSKGIRGNSFANMTFQKVISMFSSRRKAQISEIATRILNRASRSYKFSEFLEYISSDVRQKIICSLSCPVQEILTCGWNNAPRYRQHFTELQVPATSEFLKMLEKITQYESFSEEIPLLCNAWNEWSEGAAIEPCKYLDDLLLKSYLGTSE